VKHIKLKIFTIVIFFLLLVPLWGTQYQKYSNLIVADLGLESYTATGSPFDRSPFIQVGITRFFTPQVSAGILYAHSRWNDYLGMYGGIYTFKADRLSLELDYFVDLKKSLFFCPFVGINLGYNFLTVRNELGNPYEGDLKSHLSFAPVIGGYLTLGRSDENFWRNFALTVKLYWYTNGNFSGFSSTAGLFISFK
jgi:hypothetical protein